MNFGDSLQGDLARTGAGAGPKMVEWSGLLGDIERQVVHLEYCLAGMRGTMARLEEAGMYPAVPSFTWEARENDGYEQKRYLRLIFPSRTPGIARKVYVGCKAEKVAEAKRLTRNRQVWEQLDREATRLERFLRMQRASLERVAREVAGYRLPEDLVTEG